MLTTKFNRNKLLHISKTLRFRIMKVLTTECWGTILERSSVKCVKPPLFPSDKTSKNVDEEMNYFYRNSKLLHKYSVFINDPNSGEKKF